MAERTKNGIIITCAIVACIVTLLTCGTLIGGMRTEVTQLKNETIDHKAKLESVDTRQTNMETKQAFLEGVVSTRLETIQASVTKIEKRVDDLVRAE